MAIGVGIIILVLLILIVLIAASLYFYKVGIMRTDKTFLWERSATVSTDKGVGTEKQVSTSALTGEAEANHAWLSAQEIEDLTISSDEGMLLHGSYIKAAKETKRIAIAVHGYSGKGLDMAPYARLLREELEMNVLMPDNRGHGSSEGNYIGFGWHDRKDLIRWIAYMVEKIGSDAEMVLLGVSMGGATVLMASGEHLPSQVKAIIADCSYTSAEEQLKYQLKQMYKLPSFPLMQITSFVTRVRAGYTFKEASALKQVKQAKVPILFIHGEADTFVPAAMVYELYDSCSSEKELFVVPGAAHGMALATDRSGYVSKVSAFVRRWMKENHSKEKQ